MRLSDFDYHLPKEFIAQHPVSPRDHSKLMVLNRTKQSIAHHHFFELPDLLDPNSVLVFNNSKVIPARLLFQWGMGKAEILLLKPIAPNIWECLVRPGEKFVVGVEGKIATAMSFPQKRESVPGTDPPVKPEDDIWFKVKEIRSGVRVIEFECQDFKKYLKTHGHVPTPPYIKEPVRSPDEYQTIYAKPEGSVAAPTAGFHFTDRVFEGLKAKGIQTEFLTLHVGLGTFAPVKTDDITQHQIHSEWFELPKDVADRLNQAKQAGKKIVAVGTTSVRVLESCTGSDGLEARSGETNLFIYPGYKFKFIDQMITNFHVPKSSLLMLVSAFATQSHPEGALATEGSPLAGRDFILKAYELAKKEHYRFFSFGDAMWIK